MQGRHIQLGSTARQRPAGLWFGSVITDRELATIHGNDERVSTDGLGKFVEFLYRAVIDEAREMRWFQVRAEKIERARLTATNHARDLATSLLVLKELATARRRLP